MPHDRIDAELLWGEPESEVDVIDLLKYRDRRDRCEKPAKSDDVPMSIDDVGIEVVEEILVATGALLGFPVTAELIVKVFRKLRERA